MLEEQAVGPYPRVDAESAVGAAGCCGHVERVAVEHHHRNARHGLAGTVHHAPLHRRTRLPGMLPGRDAGRLAGRPAGQRLCHERGGEEMKQYEQKNQMSFHK